MPDLPQNIMSQLVTLPHDAKLKQAYLVATDLAEGEELPWDSGGGGGGLMGKIAAAAGSSPTKGIALQYWPESISDTRESVWNPRYVPGGSHPIYQWTHGGERRISFTTVFTTDTAPDQLGIGGNPLGQSGDPYGAMQDQPLSGIKKGTRDLDIRAAIGWLRYFTYPLYPAKTDIRAFEPPKIELHMPNSGIAIDGGDAILCLMTRCDVTYEDFFPSGMPRIAEVSLEFAETVQQGKRVAFQSRSSFSYGPSNYIGDYLSLKVDIL